MKKPLREEIFKYVGEKYKSQIEYPWIKFPNYCVFRHKDNRKWYGIIMNIDYSKLNKKNTGLVEVMNLKLDKKEIKEIQIGKE